MEGDQIDHQSIADLDPDFLTTELFPRLSFSSLFFLSYVSKRLMNITRHYIKEHFTGKEKEFLSLEGLELFLLDLAKGFASLLFFFFIFPSLSFSSLPFPSGYKSFLSHLFSSSICFPQWFNSFNSGSYRYIVECTSLFGTRLLTISQSTYDALIEAPSPFLPTELHYPSSFQSR